MIATTESKMVVAQYTNGMVSRILGAEDQARGEQGHRDIMVGLANFARSGGSTAAQGALGGKKTKEDENPRVGGAGQKAAATEEAPDKKDD